VQPTTERKGDGVGEGRCQAREGRADEIDFLLAIVFIGEDWVGGEIDRSGGKAIERRSRGCKVVAFRLILVRAT